MSLWVSLQRVLAGSKYAHAHLSVPAEVWVRNYHPAYPLRCKQILRWRRELATSSRLHHLCAML